MDLHVAVDPRGVEARVHRAWCQTMEIDSREQPGTWVFPLEDPEMDLGLPVSVDRRNDWDLEWRAEVTSRVHLVADRTQAVGCDVDYSCRCLG